MRSLARDRGPAKQVIDPLATLTTRERDVLDAMVEGLSRREIASALYLSVNTVRTHIQHVLSKLHVHTALEAVALTLQADRLVQRRPGHHRVVEIPRQASRSAV